MKKVVLRWPGAAVLAVAVARVLLAADRSQPVGVEMLMKNVDQYKGPVRVEGVVSAVSAEHQTLTLIDTSELEQCGVTTCAEFKLPVRWSGVMPSVRTIVRVEGVVQEQHGKRVFVATGLEKIESQEGTR